MSSLIDLSKKAKVVLEKKKVFGEKAQVIVALDISGSMSHLYSNGTVQELADRLLGIGMNMDLDKSIDIYAFGERSHEVGEAKESNHQGFVSNMMRKLSFEWSTNYAGVMQKVIDKSSVKKATGLGKFFSKKPEAPDVPTLVFFITDGDNHDKAAAEKLIKESSNQAIFWQFVGIGNASFNFLQKLDDMGGRFIDNANFFAVDDLRNITDEELYERLLNEFPQWITEARSKNILK
ncbi:VWA domain-containing protein [Cytobacillus horneckiae]|uniref:VWA domain-containing protein n=1 Tax=Cytobacillus horneckiae TaxID=549687 RepID=UPI0034CEE96D